MSRFLALVLGAVLFAPAMAMAAPDNNTGTWNNGGWRDSNGNWHSYGNNGNNGGWRDKNGNWHSNNGNHYGWRNHGDGDNDRDDRRYRHRHRDDDDNNDDNGNGNGYYNGGYNNGGYNNGGYNNGYPGGYYPGGYYPGGNNGYSVTGRIVAVNNSNVTLQNGRTVFIKGNTSVNGNLVVGERIAVTGTDAGDGNINATSINVLGF